MKILFIIIQLYICFLTLAIANDEDINELFCQLNEYAKARVIQKTNVFPCNK